MRLQILPPKCCLPFFLLTFATCGQAQTRPVPYLPIESFGIYNAAFENEPEFLKNDALHNQTRVPKQQPVSQAIDDQIHHALTLLPVFPRYLYSGCDDRAHATWMLLPKNVQSQVMKIWVVTPAKYTETIPGFIHSTRSNDPLYRAVNWGFHVALAYYALGAASAGNDRNAQLRVLDEALRPGEIITADDWFHEMETSPLTFWTLTTGDVYQFNPVPEGPHEGAINPPEWNGLHYGYENTALKNNWIPAALARDAVGLQAMSQTACLALNKMATNSGDLLTALQGTGSPLPVDCQPQVALFHSEQARWIALLMPSTAAPQ